MKDKEKSGKFEIKSTNNLIFHHTEHSIQIPSTHRTKYHAACILIKCKKLKEFYTKIEEFQIHTKL